MTVQPTMHLRAERAPFVMGESCGVAVDTIDRRLAQLVAVGAVEKQAQIRAGGQTAFTDPSRARPTTTTTAASSATTATTTTSTTGAEATAVPSPPLRWRTPTRCAACTSAWPMGSPTPSVG